MTDSRRDEVRAAMQNLLSMDLPWDHDTDNCGECWECVIGTVGIAIAMRRPSPPPVPFDESATKYLSELVGKINPEVLVENLVNRFGVEKVVKMAGCVGWAYPLPQNPSRFKSALFPNTDPTTFPADRPYRRD